MVRASGGTPASLWRCHSGQEDLQLPAFSLLSPHRSSSTALPLARPLPGRLMSSAPFLSSIPEAVRILGSLLAILLLFVLTAALVKVDLSPGLFFSITMASVWFINCKYTAPPHTSSLY